MRTGRKRTLSALLAIAMLAGMLTVPAAAADDSGPGVRKIDVWDLTGQTVSGDDYNNNITDEVWSKSEHLNGTSDGKFKVTGDFEVGDFTLNHDANDRFYSAVAGAQAVGAGTSNYGKWTFEGDDYVPNGGIYINGSASASKRYMQVKNVLPGDKLVAYVGCAQTGPTPFFVEGQGAAASDTAEYAAVDAGEGLKIEFVAQAGGAYKIYGTSSKPMYQRVVRYPGVPVTGTVTLPGGYDGPATYGVKLVNNTTKAVTEVEVRDNKFEVILAAGYSYNAVMTGAPGWGFTNASKTVTAPANGGVGENAGITAGLSVEPRGTYTYSGAISGFDSGYDLSRLVIDLIPEESAGADEERLDINTTDKTFTVTLQPDVEYTLAMTGVNDYALVSPLTVSSSGGDLTGQTITVEAKALHTASGKFISDPDTHAASDASVGSISFKILGEDGAYTYPAAIEDGGYTVQLRDGDYEAVVNAEGYSVLHHVVIKGADVEKDMLLVSIAEKPAVAKAGDVYVGYPDKANNYATINEAVDAISRMGIASEADRVTVHIAPGTYREQVVIKTPYITFINDEPDKGDALITWYYGYTYKYYSSGSDKFYSAQYAYDQYAKSGVERWGTTVRVQAAAFRAENIVFENSFNRYITEEEIADGAEPDTGENTSAPRNYATDVQAKSSTERATVICLDTGSDQSEFYNCQFLSSQDTVYTNGLAYFKNCLIEGQTDYIFGDTASRVIFDGCELRWKGYTSNSQGGYITAVRSAAGEQGYLFRNCSVTANPDSRLTVTAGYFGRPWGAGANAKFVNTKLQSAGMIDAKGWTTMSGVTPAQAQFGEYNTTTMDGTAVDTSGRESASATVMSKAQADALTMDKYYDTWIPYYYVAEEAAVAFAEGPTVTDNGDINTPYPGHTLTVSYSLGEANDANDASVIQWYRVAAGGAETLVKISTATVDKTYQIQKGDIGCHIKVTVTPATLSGNTGEARSVTVVEEVRDGFEDPDGRLDPELGDGVNIFLAGDSTVFDYSNGRDEGSWGEFLQLYFNDDLVIVADHAMGGRSSRSFINEGRLASIARDIKEGDYLFIQFGHNDCANEDNYRAERYAPLGEPDSNGVYPSTAGVKSADGTYAWDCGGTYKWFLQQYIDVALEAGATPILVTPVARLNYGSDGKITPHHDASLVPGTEETTKTANPNKSNTYCEAVRQLAGENDILCIDGFELTKAMYEAAYAADPTAANKVSDYGRQVMHSGDSTHSNKLGGMIEAALIAGAIQDLDLPISRTVKAPVQAMAVTTKGVTVFEVDGQGRFSGYDILTGYAEHAAYWEGVAQELLDAIAARAEELNGGQEEKPATEADIAALQAAIDAAGAKLTGVEESEDGLDVDSGKTWATRAAIDTLKAAIADAQATAGKAGVTKAEVEAARTAVANAAAAFVPQAGRKTPGHTHVWDEGKVTREATCTEEGEMTYTCTAGGCTDPRTTKTEAIAKTAHKYKSGKCTVCGAADPNAGGASRPAGSSAGGSTGGNSTTTTTTTTTTNSDGSTTKTETDKTTGAVTETTTKTDGTVEVVETRKDGTVTGTVTRPGGSRTETVTEPDGTRIKTETRANGARTETVTEPDGGVTITATKAGGEVVARVEVPAIAPELDYTFEDVPAGHWAESAVNAMAALGVVKGVSETGHVFDMTSDVTRGDMVQILFNLSQGTGGKAESFADVTEGAWYTGAVAWAAGAGVITGYADNTFGPNDSITREQLAVMLYRYAGLLGLDTGAGAGLSGFADGDAVSGWASDAVAWAVSKGLIQGKGANNLDPTASASRAETAVILERFLGLVR